MTTQLCYSIIQVHLTIKLKLILILYRYYPGTKLFVCYFEKKKLKELRHLIDYIKCGQWIIVECVSGFYNSNCTAKCGQCLEGVTCDKESGKCATGCKPNFHPPLCQGFFINISNISEHRLRIIIKSKMNVTYIKILTISIRN